MRANPARSRIATMARVLGVSPSGFHAWRVREPSRRRQGDKPTRTWDWSSTTRSTHWMHRPSTCACRSFRGALFRSTKSAVKLHTLLELRGNIPAFIHVSDGKMHDVNVLDILVPEPGAFYLMDRGYVDFERLFLLHTVGAFFVIRAKSNTRYERRYSHPVDKTTGVRCGQTVMLTGAKGRRHYPQPVRRIKYYDKSTEKTFNFLTNHFAVPASTVAELYRYRWQVELFFKWVKQHLRIKSFFGTSENAVKTQIWIAVTVYVLVAVLRKRLGISADLYTILQVLSLTLFEKMPVFWCQFLFIESRKH